MTHRPKKRWAVSDIHLFHKNIMKFCPTTRHGADVHEMGEIFIDQWNSVVNYDDEVFDLGDFSFGTAEQTENVLVRLNGIHHFVYGNHDRVIADSRRLQKMFASVQTELMIVDRKVEIHMRHFPGRSWDKSHYGSYHLYGHHHGALEGEPWGRSMDVGVDARPLGDMMLWSFDEIHEILSKRPILDNKAD